MTAPQAVNSSHQDANQVHSLVLVAGTLGTSDTGGTGLTMPASGNPTTGAAYVEVLGAGTQQVAGTILGGTIQNINGGSIVVTSVPQVSVGTVPNLPGGTLQNLASGTVRGTMMVEGVSASNGGTGFNTILGYAPSDADGNDTGLIVNTNTRLWNGANWQRARTAGTSYGTLGTTGAAVWGTLIPASGAGTKQYVSGVSLVVQSGTVDCIITTVGTIAAPQSGVGVLARGQFVPSGGIARDFSIPQVSGTNGTIAYFLGGAGTAYFTVNYWQGI